ncbi:restriction endonuclease subunit S [Pseudomonas protegens]|uniref:restriction endonuclease subunit S n=1 Tax=Pseudomonas protegens TaxID=380021 RepID=UPI003EC0324B
MTTLLTDNLPLLAGAPNGIKKLRELILELAVRGKLVPQDTSDEPASELLKRIAEEKARLVAEGKIKKQKALSERDAEDPAFELPAGWAWARLADVVNVLNGRAYKKEELLDAGTPVLRVGNLFTSNHWYYSTLTLEEDKYCNPGDLLFAWSASFGPFIWHGERSIFHYHIWKLDFYAKGQLSKHYLYNWLLEKTQEIKAAGHGVSMLHMTKDKMEKLAVPVPPLAEQDRIVAKVDELMALCDRLEAQQTDAESAHAQLVKALLDSLPQASDATDFATNWHRLAEHFHTLFTTESSIDKLKQTLLQLAVMGKLVSQEPDDEPVARLLQRNGIKGQPHTLQGWAEVPLGNLGKILGGSTPNKANVEFWNGDIPWVSPKDMKRPVIQDSEDHVSARALAETSLKTIPPRSLLMVVRGMILVHSFPVALTAREVTINQDMKALVPPQELSDYLLMYLQAAKATMVGLVDRSSHGTCKLISEKLWSHVVYLPPLAEQQRIVAKVDQLMALCDQIKTRLTQARKLNEQLSSTLIERAIAEDGQRSPIATDRQAARTLLAAQITHQLHRQRTFGQRKLQKVIYLAEHTARLTAIQGNYLRDAAGPHDRQLMNKVEGEMQDHQWYERIKRETVGHAYHPLSQAGQHRQAYSSTWSAAERATIEQVIELMRDWDTDRCEMTVTLYAVWNDFILEGRPVSDETIVDEVMHRWNDTKLRFGKPEWLAVLAEMKKQKILMPTGFGKRTTGGMLSLPGFE